jgi:hypothetical protein
VCVKNHKAAVSADILKVRPRASPYLCGEDAWDWGPIDKLVTIVISIGRERATTLPPQPAYRDRLGFMTGRYCKLDAGVSVDLSG